jgi:hypothetical protein
VRAALAQLPVILWIGWWIFSASRIRFHNPTGYLLIGVVTFGYIMSLWRGFTDQGSGVVQVRLTPAGVRQCTRGLGAYPYERNATGKLVPWRNVKLVIFKFDSQVGEIRLSNRESFWRLKLDRDFVHAKFSADPEDVIAIRQCICLWLVQNDYARAIRSLEAEAGSSTMPGGLWQVILRACELSTPPEAGW